MPTYEILDYGSPDGSQWGATSSTPIAFYGGTPVVQQVVTGGNVSTATNASTAISSLIVALAAMNIVRLA